MMTHVFLGPSLPLDEAQAILDAQYLPPAKQGDIISLVEEKKPQAIALIDGYFYQAVSVWHKELLWALEKGVACFGASSMGALRAAETARYGMIGVGEIYSLYRDGLDDDDEVALVHAPAEKGFLNLSFSMVNIRFTLKQAVAKGLIEPELAQQTLKRAKMLHYSERTLDIICKDLPQIVRHIFQYHYIDQKREDAKALLHMLKNETFAPPQLNEPIVNSHFHRTLYYKERSVTVEETQLPLATLTKHVALHHPNFSQVRAHALNRHLVGVLARILEIEVNEEEIAIAKEKFCQKIENLATWLKENTLSEDDFAQLMKKQALAEKLYISPLCAKWKFHKAILDELRINGAYPEWAKDAAVTQKLVPYYLDKTHEEINDKKFLQAHLKETKWDLTEEAEKWCISHGFSNVHELSYEVHRAKLARDALANQLLESIFGNKD